MGRASASSGPPPALGEQQFAGLGIWVLDGRTGVAALCCFAADGSGCVRVVDSS